MKAKKALKRLNKIESSLAVIIEQYFPSKPQFQDLLATAKTAVAEAKATVNPDVLPVAADVDRWPSATIDDEFSLEHEPVGLKLDFPALDGACEEMNLVERDFGEARDLE